MKKIVAMLLSLALLLGCAAGFAEADEKTELGTLNVNGEFRLQGRIPEGYHMSILNQNNMFIRSQLVPEDGAKPSVELIIAFSDDWADTEKLNDVTDEDLAEIEDTFRIEDEVNIEYRETGMGSKLMVVTEAVEQTDFVVIYTIYKGYELEVKMTPGTEPLNEEHIQMLIDFMTEMDFVEV